MSSSEELSQYESKPNKTFKPLKDTARDGNHPVIPRDVYHLYGVHVSNLPSGISEMLIEKTFSVVGRVQVCKVMEKKYFPSYAFVKYSLRSEAQDALSKFDGYILNGSVLAVRPAYVSNKAKRNDSPRVKNDQYETFSDDGQVKINGKGREDNPVTTYLMESTDCRIKDGRLSDSDIRMFNGTSSKTTPPRKANSGRLLAPQFKKDSLPKSSTSDTSHESHQFQDIVPSHMSTAPSSKTVHRHNKPVHQKMPISSAHTSPGHFRNNDDSGNSNSSAFRPHQGRFQEPNMPNGDAIENGIMTMSSTFSNLGFSSPEKRNTWNHGQKSGDMPRRQGGAQGVTTWSQTGGTGITSWSNCQDRSVNSPGRNQGALATEWSPQWNSVSSWSTADVVQYFYSSDCAEYAGFFQEQEIDGKALMLLNRDTLLQFLKVGPTLKVLQIIEELKSYVSLPTTGSNGW